MPHRISNNNPRRASDQNKNTATQARGSDPGAPLGTRGSKYLPPMKRFGDANENSFGSSQDFFEAFENYPVQPQKNTSHASEVQDDGGSRAEHPLAGANLSTVWNFILPVIEHPPILNIREVTFNMTFNLRALVGVMQHSPNLESIQRYLRNWDPGYIEE